jgi:CubicO group peptidase (beta-lactamase class C family)
MRRDTLFRVASLTKPMVAAATMSLCEVGTLNLDERVDRLLPELGGQRVLSRPGGPLDDTVRADRPILVEDLLTMRLGFGDEAGGDASHWPVVTAAAPLGLFAPPKPGTALHRDAWLAHFGALPLMDQPGLRWRYNTGTFVLGALLERATGQDLGAVLAERIFRPLGMTDTGFVTTAEGAARMPRQYQSDPQGSGPLTEQTDTDAAVWTTPPAFPSGSGGLLSTVDDVAAFARMLQCGGGAVLRPESVSAMLVNRLTTEQIADGGIYLDGQGWGYGLAVITNPHEGQSTGQYGWSGGYGTTWFNDPATGLIAIVMTQTSDFLWDGGLAAFEKAALRA